MTRAPKFNEGHRYRGKTRAALWIYSKIFDIRKIVFPELFCVISMPICNIQLF